MPTVCRQCSQDKLEFQQAGGREVEADFSGGAITSDAGGLLVRQVETTRDFIGDVAECFRDHRDQRYTDHSLPELLRQRIMGLACGYEDLIDHDQLRTDPLWSLFAGKADPGEQPPAGKSTLNRLETSIAQSGEGPRRYHKMDLGVDEADFQKLFTRWYIASHNPDPPEQIILDLDASDDPLHGDQQGKFFHGYYYHYCYLPLYIFAGDQLLWAELRRSNIDGAAGSTQAVAQIVGQLRRAWPGVGITLRADSGFARDELMSWCEANAVEYAFGMAKNARLDDAIAPQAEAARQASRESGQVERKFGDFSYQTRESWSRPRRVVGKAEHGPKGANPRFVVTSLPAEPWPARRLYEQLYCQRGEAENRIKEHQLYLFGTRTSCQHMKANQLRLWFCSVAYWLISELRRVGLAGTELAGAQSQTIRNKLLKIGGLVRQSVRRVYVAMSSGHAWKQTFRQVSKNIKQAWEPSPC